MIRDIFDEIRNLQREINRSFGSFFKRDDSDFFSDYSNERDFLNIKKPLADLEETDGEIIAKLEMPGLDKKDIRLDITKDAIKVKAMKKHEAKIEREGFYKQERSYKGFYRVLGLPCEVVAEKAKAKYKDGILEIRIPKARKESSKKEIKIE